MISRSLRATRQRRARIEIHRRAVFVFLSFFFPGLFCAFVRKRKGARGDRLRVTPKREKREELGGGERGLYGPAGAGCCVFRQIERHVFFDTRIAGRAGASHPFPIHAMTFIAVILIDQEGSYWIVLSFFSPALLSDNPVYLFIPCSRGNVCGYASLFASGEHARTHAHIRVCTYV